MLARAQDELKTQGFVCLGTFQNTLGILRIRFHLETRRPEVLIVYQRGSLLGSERLSGLFLENEACSLKKSNVWEWASLAREENQMLLVVGVRDLTAKISLFIQLSDFGVCPESK